MELIELKTKDGFRLEGPYWPADGKIAAILVHGATNFYDPEDKYVGIIERFFSVTGELFSKSGIATLAVRNLGSYRPEFFNDCVLDIQAYIDFLKSKGYEKLILIGYSLGAAKCAYFADTQDIHSLSALILMSSSPLIHGLYSEEEVLAKARMMQANGEELHYFSRKEGSIYSWYQPKAYLRNYEEAYQKDTLDVLENVTLPILSFAMEKEWDWFHQVTDDIKERAKKSPKIDTYLFPEVSAHMYTDSEEKIARYVLNWIQANVT